MIFMVLLIQTVLSVWSEEPPDPPTDVHVDNWQLTWTPPSDETGLTYTVQSRDHSEVWSDVSTCAQISSTSCDVTLTAAKGKHDCVRLQVLAERRGLASAPAEACVSHGFNRCTPQVSLSARPGSLTVNLSRNHSLAEDHVDNLQHRVYYNKEGETEQFYHDSRASLPLLRLQEGQRYCAQVEFLILGQPVGPPTCPQCELIPHTDVQVHPGVIVGVVVVMTLLIVGSAYIIICQSGRIKRWLHPPCEIPHHFHRLQSHHDLTPSPTDEHFDVIDCVTPEERRE
ncbi:interferon gamma receptor 2 isoform X2 [Notolabrus celidotus]|uniref:interferon gamma receptor 2 isoform X2 n=1 Tax=Notolabrus celidotus TaxID=1203425 RepID=UPI00149056D3|nr:interferon gamma receptor 2 isoform X2 [Notolabrus celidotus]